MSACIGCKQKKPLRRYIIELFLESGRGGPTYTRLIETRMRKKQIKKHFSVIKNAEKILPPRSKWEVNPSSIKVKIITREYVV